MLQVFNKLREKIPKTAGSNNQTSAPVKVEIRIIVEPCYSGMFIAVNFIFMGAFVVIVKLKDKMIKKGISWFPQIAHLLI